MVLQYFQSYLSLMFLLLFSLSLSKLKRDPVARLASSFPHPTKGPKQWGYQAGSYSHSGM